MTLTKRTFLKFAIWVSIATTLLLFLAGLTSVLRITIPSLIFGFALVPMFITTISTIYFWYEPKSIFSLLGVLFSVMYGVLISFNYYLQLTLMQKNIAGLELFEITNQYSIFFVIEILGYFFMGLGTLALVPVFRKSAIEKWIKWIFILNGILGIGGLLGYGLNINIVIMLIGLMVWNIIMPIATALLAIYFSRELKSLNKQWNMFE